MSGQFGGGNYSGENSALAASFVAQRLAVTGVVTSGRVTATVYTTSGNLSAEVGDSYITLLRDGEVLGTLSTPSGTSTYSIHLVQSGTQVTLQVRSNGVVLDALVDGTIYSLPRPRVFVFVGEGASIGVTTIEFDRVVRIYNWSQLNDWSYYFTPIVSGGVLTPPTVPIGPPAWEAEWSPLGFPCTVKNTAGIPVYQLRAKSYPQATSGYGFNKGFINYLGPGFTSIDEDNSYGYEYGNSLDIQGSYGQTGWMDTTGRIWFVLSKFNPGTSKEYCWIEVLSRGCSMITVSTNAYYPVSLRLEPSNDAMLCYISSQGEVKCRILSYSPEIPQYVVGAEYEVGVQAMGLGTPWMDGPGVVTLPYTDMYGVAQLIHSDAAGDVWTP